MSIIMLMQSVCNLHHACYSHVKCLILFICMCVLCVVCCVCGHCVHVVCSLCGHCVIDLLSSHAISSLCKAFALCAVF